MEELKQLLKESTPSDLSEIFSDMLRIWWGETEFSADETLTFLESFEGAMGDQALDVDVRLRSDDNDYD